MSNFKGMYAFCLISIPECPTQVTSNGCHDGWTRLTSPWPEASSNG